MGYYTRFEMKVISAHGEVDGSIYPEFEEENIYGDSVSIQSLIEGDYDSMKWYECESDMIKFSKKYPELVFVLDGEGEEAGDIWRKFFKNGKMYAWQMPKPKPPEWSEEIEERLE